MTLTKGESMRRAGWLWLVLLVLLALVGSGCGGDEEGGGGAGGTGTGGQVDKVTLQLKWVTQAQFAGYYAAQEQGYYADEGLELTIRPGGPDIVPEQAVLGGQADIGIDWQDNLLATRDQGGEIVNIGQVFTRSGMTEIMWKDTGFDSLDDLRGKKVAVWLAGNEHKLFAALAKNGLDAQTDVEIVNQPFDMNLFLNREVDAAAAMTYNELAQVLETENPDTGELYQLEDLNVVKLEDIGIGSLEDGLFARADWLAEEANQDIAKRFLKASFKGWIYCRDNPDDCVQYVLEAGSTLPEGHQRWMMNEINALIWPAPLGIGIMDPAAWQRTVDVVTEFEVVQSQPSDDGYRTDLAEAAVAELEDEGLDVKGEEYTKPEVEVTPGGE
jgi:NitT/TauT family transport system substrate-binding protein